MNAAAMAVPADDIQERLDESVSLSLTLYATTMLLILAPTISKSATIRITFIYRTKWIFLN